jgi:hypothetical protein
VLVVLTRSTRSSNAIIKPRPLVVVHRFLDGNELEDGPTISEATADRLECEADIIEAVHVTRVCRLRIIAGDPSGQLTFTRPGSPQSNLPPVTSNGCIGRLHKTDRRYSKKNLSSELGDSKRSRAARRNR